MDLNCPYCESKLKIKVKNLKNNIAFKCPKCKNTVLYRDSQVLPYSPAKQSRFLPFYCLLINNEPFILKDNYHGFRIHDKDKKLIADNENPDFVLQITPRGYLLINEKERVSINGETTEKKILSLGDHLFVNDIRIVYFDGYIINKDKQLEKELTSGAQTLELNMDKDKEKWKEFLEKKSSEEENNNINARITRAELMLKSDDEDNITFEILKEAKTTIGRGFTDISIMDPRMSKKHSIISFSRKDKCFIVQDLHSTNGTYVNGMKIERSKLNNGDVIQIGNTFFTFRTV